MQENNLFLSQNEIQSKTKRLKIFIALNDFLYKVLIVQYGFSSLFSAIIRILHLFLEATFLTNFYTYNKNPLFHVVEISYFNFPYTLSLYTVGKDDFSLTRGNKRISNRNLALMLHIFQQSENRSNPKPCNGNRISI